MRVLNVFSMMIFVSYLCVRDSVEVPDEFFDDAVEAEKEFCDISMSLMHKRGLEGINSIQVECHSPITAQAIQ